MPQTYNVGARSLFVTATAWVFIVLAILTSMSALVQNAAIGSLMPGLQVATERMPLLTGLLIGYLPWVVGTGLAMSLATLASAIGLLMRLDWARRSFIALMVVAIFANLLGLWLQQEVVQSVVNTTLSSVAIPQQAMDVFGGFVTAARVMAVLMTLAGCALLGWIIGRLMSQAVRQEFA
ncbi:MAG: hypothetical protein H7Z19_00195 [Chitinophagaceae bacterium]|nr:hypothetical protein [Rubrivivax sp.]